MDFSKLIPHAKTLYTFGLCSNFLDNLSSILHILVAHLNKNGEDGAHRLSEPIQQPPRVVHHRCHRLYAFSALNPHYLGNSML